MERLRQRNTVRYFVVWAGMMDERVGACGGLARCDAARGAWKTSAWRSIKAYRRHEAISGVGGYLMSESTVALTKEF